MEAYVISDGTSQVDGRIKAMKSSITLTRFAIRARTSIGKSAQHAIALKEEDSTAKKKEPKDIFVDVQIIFLF